MRNLKRFLAMTITMLMVVGLFSFSGSVAAFDDVVDYQKQIELMSLLNIVQGYDADNFGYGEDVERWHMALWIAKIMTGKVDDAYVNWYSTTNYTAFADLSVDHFYGSISYCNDNNVVIGTSPTTFEPANGITIQDVFTMVVRMLGYGSSSMDSRYPWSFINKAIELGLDDGLDADYNNEDVATREQAAAILYNALFTKKADGTTYAESKFNLTIDTVVITGTSRANMFAMDTAVDKTLAGVNYVAFNRLGADGNLVQPTYYLRKTAFGLDSLDENLYFGQSFKVVTRDNFASLLYCEMIDSVVLDQKDFDGVKDGATRVTIEGKSYNAVPGYTRLYNRQNTKNTDELELIVYSVGITTIQGTGSYVMDKDLNILDGNGKVLLKYFGNLYTFTLGGVYLYEVEPGKFVEPDAAIWARAARADTVSKWGMLKLLAGSGFTSAILYANNAYSDTVLYDDDYDGIYDRAFYTGYKFGKISKSGDATPLFRLVDGVNYVKTNGSTVPIANIVFVNADTHEKIALADLEGKYVLYAFNELTNYVFIKEIFVPKVGLVTGVNIGAAEITFDAVYYNTTTGQVAGTKYGIGNGRLPGAVVINDNNRAQWQQLQGKVVNYIEKDGRVLALFNDGFGGKNYIVVDDVVGVTTTGYLQLLVYNNSNIKSVITVNRIDGAWYGNYMGVISPILSNYAVNYKSLYKGKLFIGNRDAIGNWDLTTVRDDKDYTYYFRNTISKDLYCLDHKTIYPSNNCTNNCKKVGPFQVSIEFINGIAVPTLWWDTLDGKFDFMAFESANGTAKKFEQFRANADTVFVLLDETGGVLTAAKGIPQNGSYIDIYKGIWLGCEWYKDAQIYVVTKSDDASIASFVYIKYGAFRSFKTNSGWNNTAGSTIIFIDTAAKNTEAYTNQTDGYAVTAGAVYTYTKAVDVIRGGEYADKILVYNKQLKVGSFYRIVDGYVQEEIIPGNNSAIRVGHLEFIETYQYVLTTAYGNVLTENYTTNYAYELKGNAITRDANLALVNKRADIGKAINGIRGEYATVYYYAGIEVVGASGYEYTGTGLTMDDFDTNARVFIFTEFAANLPARAADFKAIGQRYNRLWLSTGQPQYIETVVASGAEVLSYYEITLDAYNALSRGGFFSNDIYNLYDDYKIGTLAKLYDSTGKLIVDFNEDNVFMFTKMHVTNGSGTRYYLVFTAKPTWKQADITATGAVYLTWTNTDNLNVTYKLELPSLGIRGCHPVVSVIDTKDVTPAKVNVGNNTIKNLFDVMYSETPGVQMFTNVYNVADPKDAIWNLKSWKVFGDVSVPTTYSFGGAYGFVLDYGSKWPSSWLSADEVILSWNMKDVYVAVPIIPGHTAKVEYYYTFNNSHWSYDGTNGNKSSILLWDTFFADQDWHHNIVWNKALLATSTSYLNINNGVYNKSYNQSASLHPDLYDVYVVPVREEGVIVKVTYTAIVYNINYIAASEATGNPVTGKIGETKTVNISGVFGSNPNDIVSIKIEGSYSGNDTWTSGSTTRSFVMGAGDVTVTVVRQPTPPVTYGISIYNYYPLDSNNIEDRYVYLYVNGVLVDMGLAELITANLHKAKAGDEIIVKFMGAWDKEYFDVTKSPGTPGDINSRSVDFESEQIRIDALAWYTNVVFTMPAENVAVTLVYWAY